MAEVTPEGLASKIVAEIPNFFRDAFDQAVTGEGAYIRDGEPRGQVAKIGQAVARSYCRQYGANPGAAKFGNAERIENACRPYLEDIDPGNGPEIALPFTGGQCAGQAYGARYTWTSSPGANPQNYTPATGQFLPGSRTLYGPVSFGGLVLGGGGICGPTSEAYLASGFFSNGTTPRVGALNRGGTACFFPGSTDTIGAVSFERLDGGAECGNPAPVVRQPRAIPDPTGPSFRFNPSPEIDIEIGVEVKPDGTIDVDIGTGPINVDLFPPEGGSGGSGGSDEDPPGDVGEEDTEGAEDADEDGNASGCAGENQVIGGLKIDILTIPASARVFAPGIYRGACYIYMGAEDKLDQDFGGSMIRDGQFFLPEKENLTCWEVQANLGYRLRVTPYYKTIEEDGSTTA